MAEIGGPHAQDAPALGSTESEPAEADPAPVEEPTQKGRRRVGWLGGVLVLVLLLLCGAVTGLGLGPSAAPVTAARRFVPTDAARGFARFTEGSDQADAMVENALVTGDEFQSSVPAALWQAMVPAPGVPASAAHWWREGVVVTGFNRPSQRYRIRSIDADGVRLHGQEWGSLGISFAPALLELPADLSAGRSWTSTGQALADPTTTLLDYQNTSSAAAPDDAADAAAGCLRVRSSTTLRQDGRTVAGGPSSSWTEANLWCPGRGVVQSSGDFRGTRFAIGRLAAAPPGGISAAGIAPTSMPASAPSGWRSGPLTLDDGDDTFGDHPGQVLLDDSTFAMDTTGTLHVLNSGERDVNTITPLSDGTYWAHGWLRPGGSVTGIATVGKVVAVGTSARRLLGYDFAGRLHWSAALPDVSVVPPLALPTGRLIVATVSGDVLAFDARTGRRLWSQRLSASIGVPPAAGDKVLVVGTADGQVTGLDLTDGHQLWQRDISSVSPASLVIGDVAVSMTYGELSGRELSTGRLRWAKTGLGDTDSLHQLNGELVVLNGNSVHAYRSGTGTPVWERQGHFLDALDFAGSGVLLGNTAMVSVDGSGTTTGRWSLAARLDDSSRLLAGPGQLWAIGTQGVRLAGSWVGPRSPGQR